jgi:hypothetical protein
MIVECIANTGAALPSELVRPEMGLTRERSFALVVGKNYVVYGMTVFLGHLWYYLSDEDDLYYPVWKPSHLFRIVDGGMSQYWRLGMYTIDSSGATMPIIAFPEWATNPVFYDRLTDGDADAVSLFNKYKTLIDDEAANASAGPKEC